MPLSWNEIRQKAHAFAKEWAGETDEDAEAKTFWNEFFEVFGVRRRTVASFEEPVKNLAGNWAFIDLFWPSKLLVEHKSKGKSLSKANSQAMEYIRALKDAGRDKECPRFVVVSDFDKFAFYDLDDDKSYSFGLADLHKNIHLFAFIAGYVQQRIVPDDPLNIEAVELLGELHDELEAGGYTGHELERFLVRILFCLFADKTGIFEEPNAFALYVENHTEEDGSDLGVHLDRFFRVLDTERAKRQKNLDEDLAILPHVNGELFKEKLGFADLNRAMRDKLLNCTRFDWSKISPAVFGSLFQSVMEAKERRQVGAHYTSEQDILKLVKSLFLDDLRAEFERVKGNKARLRELHNKLAGLKFLDPACGCGNFLVVTYRELRLLELDVLKAIHGGQKVIDIYQLSHVDVDSMYGIEINEFPARIAEVALWLVDHQMNQAVSAAFGLYYVRLPLIKTATIIAGNALRIDWNDVLSGAECTYILGNPPFVGHAYQSAEQKADQKLVMGKQPAFGILDYVCNWYVKASAYIQGTTTRVGFVSTNSITQGEQAGLLWNELFRRYQIKIQFGHRTFAWKSEARGRAHVHVVIIGFGLGERNGKFIYDYDIDPDRPQLIKAKNISPYLIEGPDNALVPRTKPICNVPKMSWGNKPTDGGNLVLSPEERADLLTREPAARKYVYRYMSGGDFINGIERYCLWLVDLKPKELASMPLVKQRVLAVKKSRLESKAPSTREYAKYPTLFRQIAQPESEYLAIPEVSSQTRRYIPIAFLSKDVICSNKIQFIPDATLYLFGVLTSSMHMAWVKHVGGRLKSDPSYSNTLIYNNFPWPLDATEKQKAKVEEKGKAVLAARDAYPESNLADLYDPVTMPAKLAKAHSELDRAVDLCYRKLPFANDRLRVEFLLEQYERITKPLTASTPRTRPKRAAE